ncbi:helix-hairpin-helix domain-containing protein [Subsaximicrobium wynnwilliamsii]|uniref:Helix-hairpin-helix domain-containing protein n=1 Tax=Subsaximicrobium wynnwilliamsii TaxID=291179 RepID=A0A5C6ZCQ7_9FLAO|nr:helix-hairpin-helix domain-containing protein [Subsaximicrobium wynnwilliamsii]TXD81755.1 helix-hairpin-helix domain-containing protein [Subsaximicrobium wynnwilliamsii]TXD87581.1 helix-hairpin-helix domain-containing protein [Subsaximicrobium wynnwilliamsii]TXE01254.1 helix-hairpin-helix domain-containing protein [Subsaximicrobium wynnwilliamsii]
MKSHFQFTRKQRSGIFLLLLLILIAQCAYFFIDFSSEEIQPNPTDLELFQAEVDSLKLVKQEAAKPKIYPFNPNYITDFKGYSLGMSNAEIDRLLNFRSTNQWINSAEDFQRVTQVSDSLLAVLSPNFKFPEWVTNPKPKPDYGYSSAVKPKSFQQKVDLNVATAAQLQKVNGIGEKLSVRIVEFRTRLGGKFIADVQLKEVYGLSPEVIERVLNEFTVKSAMPIKTVNLNTATLDQLVTIPHIDYEIAQQIIESRILREGFNSLEELTKVKEFPIGKFEIIRLYLTLD